MSFPTFATLFAPLVAALGAVTANAQIAPVPVPAPARDIASLTVGHGLESHADGLLGTGSDYSARFSADGLSFTPVLGGDAAPCPPLRLAFASARHGATALPAADVVAPQADGDTAVYARSAALRERYELRDRGVEQSFVFSELPGRGDLVVRCRLDGLGSTPTVAGDGGLDFWHDGRRLAHLGGVTGIDAHGATVAGQLHAEGEWLELTLPAAFVDRAALPLVLDPFLTASGLNVSASSGSFDHAPDVCYDAVGQRWLFVWQRDVSLVQSDLMLRTWSASAGYGTLTTMVGASGLVNTKPKIAYHTGIARSLVVFQQQTSALAPASVQGIVIEANLARTAAINMGVPVGSCTDPDVSGDPTGSGMGVVVYAISGVSIGIRARPYTLGATGTPVLGSQVTVNSSAAAVRPRVSKSAGPRLAVVWEDRPSTFATASIRAMTRAGVLSGGTFALGNPGGGDLHRPEVDGLGDGSSFLMVLEYQRGFGDRDVTCAEWTWNGNGFGAPTAMATISGTAGIDEAAPTVAFLGQKYAVAWEQQTQFVDGTIHLRNLTPGGCLACGADTVLVPVFNHYQPSLAGDFASGGTGNLAMLACDRANLGTAGYVYGYLWSAYANPAPTVLGPGCGNVTTLQVLGPAGIGNTTFGFRVSSGDPQASIGLFSLGIGASSPLLPCGSCLLVNPIVLDAQVLVGGAATYSLPIPCNLALIGFGLQAQGLVIGSTQNACPALGTLSASGAVGVVIAE